MTRLTQDQIPNAVLAFVQGYFGAPIVAFENQSGGYSRGAAARVRAENGGRGFLKTICEEGFAGTFELYRRERDILHALPLGISVPRLLASYEEDGWIALLIEDVDGHHPATSAEMHAVLDAVLALPTADCVPGLPDAAEDLAEPFTLWQKVDSAFRALTPWAVANQERLADAAAEAIDAVSGNDLVHSDLRPDNVLIDSEGKAWLVDWPWAARAAGWYDALLFALDCSLNFDDVDLERTVLSHPAFEGVAARSVDAVLAGFAGYYVYASEQPAVEVAPAVREFQFKNARAILGWLEKRWSEN